MANITNYMDDLRMYKGLFDSADEELKTEIRKNRLNELTDKIKENEIKIKSIKMLQSPDIAQDLMIRMMKLLKRYMKLNNLITGSES